VAGLTDITREMRDAGAVVLTPIARSMLRRNTWRARLGIFDKRLDCASRNPLPLRQNGTTIFQGGMRRRRLCLPSPKMTSMAFTAVVSFDGPDCQPGAERFRIHSRSYQAATTRLTMLPLLARLKSLERARPGSPISNARTQRTGPGRLHAHTRRPQVGKLSPGGASREKPILRMLRLPQRLLECAAPNSIRGMKKHHALRYWRQGAAQSRSALYIFLMIDSIAP